MPQRPTSATQDQIVTAIVARLCATVPEFNETNCFVSDAPEPLDVPRGDVFCMVIPGDGQYDQVLFDGGGTHTCCEVCEMSIETFVLTRADATDSAAIAMLNPERGTLSRFKGAILTSMLVNWEPMAAGVVLLRDGIIPTRATPGRITGLKTGMYIRMSQQFRFSWDWALGEVDA